MSRVSRIAFPLTVAETGLRRRDLGSSHVQLVRDLEGKLDVDRLRAACRVLLDRHRPGGIVPGVAMLWHDLDLTDLPYEEGMAEAGRLADEDRRCPFDTEQPPSVRFTLIHLGGHRYRLLFTHPHALAGGWLPRISHELFDVYDGRTPAAAPAHRDVPDRATRQDRERTCSAGPDEARDFLCAQYEASATGEGRLIVLSGGIAGGKTWTQNELLEHAAGAGALTLTATGVPEEQELGLGVLDQLLTGSGLLPETAGILDTGPEGAGQAQVVQDACQAILRLAKDRPVVITVDDVQFADEPSVRLLSQLQRRIRSARLLVVLTQRSHLRSAHLRLRAEFARQPHQHVQLEPLSEQAVGALATEVAGERVADLAVARLRELGGGNPLLVRALLEDHRSGGRMPGGAFTQAVPAILRRADVPVREVAAALAVLGRHGTAGLVVELTGHYADVTDEALENLGEMGLVADGRFRDISGENAVLDGLAPATRARLHVRAAEVMYRRAFAVKEVARHLIAAGESAGDWSAGVLRDAGDQAMVTGDLAFATRCLELALSVVTEGEERRVLLRLLALTAWRVNPAAMSAGLAELKAAEDPEFAETLVVLRHALWHGDRAETKQAFEVLAGAPEPVNSERWAELRLARQWHFGPELPTRDEADPWGLAAASLARFWTEGAGSATTESAQRILWNCRLGDMTLEALGTALLALGWGDHAEQAEEWCSSLVSQAEKRGAVTWRALFEGVWALVQIRRGDPAGAALRARAALDLLEPQSWGTAVAYPLTALVLAETATGAFDAVATTLRYPVPDAMFDTVGGLLYLRARGHYFLSTGRSLAAVSDFQLCQRVLVGWGTDVLTPVPWRTDLAEANLKLGKTSVARTLAKEQLRVAAEGDAYSRGLALRVLGLASDPGQQTWLLKQSADLLAQTGDQPELARTYKVTSQLEARPAPAGPAAVGREPLKTPGPRPLPRRLPLPPTVLTSSGEPFDEVLSEAELRVAQLAVMGYTNREIGGYLYITVSTVEQHLTRVYRKLGVRGRSSLPRELGLTDLRSA